MDKTRNANKITVLWQNRRVHVEVSKYTTCDDVIEMVLYDTPEKPNTRKYGLYASAHGADNLLTGKALVTKVVRSYGVDRANLQLYVRKVANKQRMALPVLTIKISTLLAKTHSKTMDRTVINTQKSESADTLRPEADVNISNVYNSLENSTFGKVALLKRFIEEVAHDAKQRQCETDANEKNNKTEPCDLDVAFIEESDTVSNMTVSSNDQSRTDPDRSESGISTTEDSEDLNKCRIYDSSEPGISTTEDSEDLNKCIIHDSSESGISTTEEPEDLNKCRIYDESSDTDSAFQDLVSECDSDSDVNVISTERIRVSETDNMGMDKIRSILNKVGVGNETHDQLLESFMKTLVQANDMDDVDEGVSSMESEYSRSL